MSSDPSVLSNYFSENPDQKILWNKNRKLPNDPRVTKIGYFLREFSLDELPQIYNVLRGNMSFIGPRPILEDELIEYGDSSYRFYITVKPGISGLWQVSGRADTTFKKRVDIDLYYIKNQSFFLDMEIFFRTFIAILSRKGAH